MSIEWASGLYEGEGYIGRQPRNSLYMTISSTDLDTLQKFQSIMGGRIKGPRHDGNSLHKPRWEWNITSRNEVLTVVELMYPHLCSRRRKQIDVAVKGLSRLPQKRTLKETDRNCGYIKDGEITSRGAKRHLRRGERPCPICAKAQRLYNRQWHNRIEANQ